MDLVDLVDLVDLAEAFSDLVFRDSWWTIVQVISDCSDMLWQEKNNSLK